MKRIVLLFMLLTLSACLPSPEGAPTPAAQTSEISKASEVLPTPTPLPPTETPTPTENPSYSALLGLGYEPSQLTEYKNFAEGTYSFPGDTVVYNGIIGTKANGSKEMLAIKFSDNPNYLKLSSTEINKLGDEAGSAGTCFSHGKLGSDPITWINATSTGIVLSRDKINSNGDVIAKTKSLLVVTTADNGAKRLIEYILELVDPSNPNQDLRENFDLFFLVLSVVNLRRLIRLKN